MRSTLSGHREVHMERTKEATRDYPSFARTPWTLWETLYARRSHRKYLPGNLDPDLEGALRHALRLALEARGAGEGSLLAVTDPHLVAEFRRRAHRGAPNKINLWLTRAPILGFLALAVPAGDAKAERPRELPRAVMAAQDVVLWLTERGLGTCWLGGVNQQEVRKLLGLGRDMAVPAAVSFGKPKPRVKAPDFDHLVYRTISRHRRPLPAVARLQGMDGPYVVRDWEGVSLSVSPVQDVEGLLRGILQGKESDGDVPLEPALEACLEAARIAPSAGNAQRWCFVAVTGEERLARLAAACDVDAAWRAAVVGMGRPGG